MEEFLKNKAEELDYLINEREKLDNKSRKTAKDKADLEAISNLIKELSEQLGQKEVKETSKELADWNLKRIELDNKKKKNKRDKSEINEINEILKMLSEKLKEMSSRKEIEEYEAEEEASQQKLNDYNKQLEALNTLEQKLAPTAYNLAREEIEKLIEQETIILSYNERIISTYNLLKENNSKLNIISEIEKQEELKTSYEKKIPTDLLADSSQQVKYKNKIIEDKEEVKKLSKYLNELKELQKDRKEHYDLNEVEKIQKEIISVEKRLIPLQSRLDQNEQIISNYLNLKETDRMIKILSSELSNTDSKENISIIIENCKRILPENLQQSAIIDTHKNHDLYEVKKEPEILQKNKSQVEEEFLDEEATSEEMKDYFDKIKKKEESEQENISELAQKNSEPIKEEPLNPNFDKISENFKNVQNTIKSFPVSFNSKKEAYKGDKVEEIVEELRPNKSTKSSEQQTLKNEDEQVKNILNEMRAKNSEGQNDIQVQSPNNSYYPDSQPSKNEPEILKEEDYEEEYYEENDYDDKDYDEMDYEKYIVLPKGVSPNKNGYSTTFSPISDKKRASQKEVTGIRKAFKDIKKILRNKKVIIGTTLVLLATGVIGVSMSSNKRAEKYQKGDPNAIKILDETEQIIEETDEIDILTEYNTEPEYSYETDTVEENNIMANIETEKKDKTTAKETLESETEELIKEIKEEIKPISNINEEPKEQDTLGTVSFLNYLKSENPNSIKEYSTISKEQMDEVLKDAFYNSNLRTNVAQDEYAVEKGDWTNIKEENFDYWTDAPLTFVEDPNGLGKDVYLVQQPDENGVLTGMYWTDEETMNNYNSSLEESIEKIMNKGRGSR